jgi:GT2 family glycosyltransferase
MSATGRHQPRIGIRDCLAAGGMRHGDMQDAAGHDPIETAGLPPEVPAMNDISPGQAGPAGNAAADANRIAALHRSRFLAPLCVGRLVLLCGGDAAAAVLAEVAGQVAKGVAPKGGAEVVLALDPAPPQVVLAAAPGLIRALRPGGVLVLVSRPDDTPDGGLAALAALLAGSFRHLATYRQRPLVGTLLDDARFDGSRVVALADAPAPPDTLLHVCSTAPLPDLAGGVFAAPLAAAAGLAAGMLSPVGPAIVLANPIELPDDGLRNENALDLRRRAVSLVERLVERDEIVFDLLAETARLRRQLAEGSAGGGGSSGFFEPPRTSHGWPLAEKPETPVATLGLYDHRVDDEVILEGRAGAGFLERFSLTGDTPVFDAAIAALNETPKRLQLRDEADAAPEVSIIIPVYGQLGYTLNCLDSLFRHASRYSAEIIVIDDVSPDQSGEKLPAVAGIRCRRQAVNGGFINSCHTGAAMARGRYLVMLNNDTRVVAGWLDELIGAFDLFPAAGLVGSKLLYPDGTLQEAGGILWRDGSAWNYGRNDDPNRPQYCHARQADYISGATIALPTALWRELDGFDVHYRPAYCEDADLCLRVRAAGREVWFQPQSRIIHYEGRTSGTDTRQGVKAYQVVNTKKLFLRWRDRLQAHRPNGQAPYFERERDVVRRMLVVDATAPTPNQDAGSVQIVLALRLAQKLGYKTHFVPEDNFLFQPRYTTDLLRLGIDCAYAPYDVGFETYIRRYGHLFDVVMGYRVPVLEKIHDLVREHAPQAPLLFNIVDLHYLRMRREAELEGDAERLEAAAAMRARELAMIGRTDCTITHSSVERQLIETEVPGVPVRVLPLTFDFFGTKAGFAQRRDICFLGGYRHPPNIDAVTYFVERIFPILRREQPGIRFIIAGAKPTLEVLALAAEDIVVTGLVEDLRDLFDHARVFVCPLRVGAGVKGKVAAAIAYGIPVVTTSVGIEGVDFIDGEHVLVANDADAFAAATLRAYRDEALWEHLSRQSQTFLREQLSPEMCRLVLADSIEAGYRHRLGLDAAV